MNLKVFLGKQKLPKWTVTAPKGGKLEVLDIKPEVRQLSMAVEELR
jgi:phenylalanyl-tRNA synthetase beta chain